MLLVAILFALFCNGFGIDNGVGRTPAMGYNTWDDFRCQNISEVNLKLAVDSFVRYDLRKYGYEYINIDDCWAVKRDANNRVVPDPVAFPNGMKTVADYVHSHGLKFGIYTDRGTLTCAKRPGSQGYEEIDAQTYAEWGVDYLKEDSCYATDDHQGAFEQYGKMRDALNKTGRQIYFSLCGWNSWYAPQGSKLGNSWRVAGDVNTYNDMWNAVFTNSKLQQYAGPGSWNDPDLLIGTSTHAAVHLTEDQSRSQFSLWSIMAAPLLIGSNMLNMNQYDLETYTNIEVIAIDQDPNGVQGTIVWQNCPTSLSVYKDVPSCQQIWSKPLSDGSHAVFFINWGTSQATVTCDASCFKSIGYTNAVKIRDLWQHLELGMFSTFSSVLRPLGASRTLRFYQ